MRASCGYGVSSVFFIAQRHAADPLSVGRLGDVHDFMAV
jgi:hypothetical protein